MKMPEAAAYVCNSSISDNVYRSDPVNQTSN